MKKKYEKFTSHIGKRYGRLMITGVVDEYDLTGNVSSLYKKRFAYICDCGYKGAARCSNILMGITISCGCAKRGRSGELKRTKDGRFSK